ASTAHPDLLASTSLLFSHTAPNHRDLHSFPTRRSSDLCSTGDAKVTRPSRRSGAASCCSLGSVSPARRSRRRLMRATSARRRSRSEEHTSELQSRFDLVCRLLLEKKKSKNTEGRTYSTG